MHIFEWKEEFATGFEAFDAELQAVMRLADDLESALQAGAARPELLRKFDDTVTALQSGMERQELLLKQASYPAYRFHKREHDDLLQILMEFRTKVVEGSANFSISSLEFLGGWLVSHFRSEDRCAAQFLAQPLKVS
ncbi:MAG: hemerythrin domain-containing protein [Acidobacteriota bacterium]